MNHTADPTSPLVIDALQATDRAEWGVLAKAYKEFYKTEIPESDYGAAFARLLVGNGGQAWVARRDGRMIGIAHFLFHSSPWMADVCYLQDLYVEEAARGLGVAAALIERVAHSACARGAPRFYWTTQEGNVRARALYDRLAEYRGFVRYDYPVMMP